MSPRAGAAGSAALWLRASVPLVLTLGVALVAAYQYRRGIGSHGATVRWHLALVALWLASLYGAAALLPTRWRAARWLLAGAGVLPMLLFYAALALTMNGLRDLPLRSMVLGYWTQLYAMAAALPIGADLWVMAAALFGVVALSWIAIAAWGMLAAQRGLQRAWPSIGARALLCLVPLSALLALFVHPWSAPMQAAEPVLRSWHNRPLALSNVELQANPAEAAADARLLQAYPQVPGARRADVIFIYVDGLRADILRSYGGSLVRMPFVEGLVASGALQQVNETWATCSTTLCGLTSLLQSRPAHRVHPGNLSMQKVLAKQGWQIRYLLGGDHQNFLILKDFYGPRIDFYLDGMDMDPARSTDDRLLLEHLHRLPRATPEAPQFIMLGLMSTHALGVRGLDFRRHKPDELGAMDFNAVKQEAIGIYRNHYRNGVLQADHMLERVWQWLGAQGYLDTAVIVITSDHGELLGEHGMIGHSRGLSTPELRVPWWIRVPPALARAIGPQATQLADAHPYSYQTDVAPTILDLLGLPLPESWTGQSLLRPREPRALPLYFVLQQNLFGLIFDVDGRPWKYLQQRDRGSDGFYDLRADPLDQHDGVKQLPPAVVQQVRSQTALIFAARMAARDVKAAEKAAQKAASAASGVNTH